MLILPNHNNAVTNPSDLKGFTFKQLEDIRALDAKSVFIFVMPTDLKKLEPITGQLNTKKVIYKTGFLNEVYEILYPDMTRQKVFENVTVRYDIFINYRQFQRNVQIYNSKKSSIFAEQCI